MQVNLLHKTDKTSSWALNTGDELKADEKFMSEHPDIYPKTLTLRIEWKEFTRRGCLGYSERHGNIAWKFEKDKENQDSDAAMLLQPVRVKRPQTGMGLMLLLYMRQKEGQRDVASTMRNRKDKLDTAIEQCRKICYLDEGLDPL